MVQDRWFAILFLGIGVFVVGLCFWLGRLFSPDGNVPTAFWGGLLGGSLFGVGGQVLWQRRHSKKDRLAVPE